MSLNYKGNIHQIFFDVLKKDDGFSVGAKLTHLEKLSGKKYIELKDQEVYELMEGYVNSPQEKDEKLTDEEFMGWVNAVYPNGETERIFVGNSVFLET